MHTNKMLRFAVAAGVLVPTIALFQPRQTVANTVDSQTIHIQFEGRVGSEPFACGDTYRLGTADTAVTPLDFRFYVSEVALIDTAGNEVPLVLAQDGQWQYQNVALLDFEDKTGACTNGTDEMRTQVVGSVPTGEYRGLTFTLGVPFALNHIDSTLAPSPLNLTSLWWNWNFGYKFARVDFEAVMDAASQGTPQVPVGQTAVGMGHKADEAGHGDGHAAHSQGFSIHLGSVGCQMDAAQVPVGCSSPNRPDILLSDFDPASDSVVVDIAALLANTNLAENQEDTPVGCMSSTEDNDCSGIMQNLGLPFPDQAVVEQTVFSLQSVGN